MGDWLILSPEGTINYIPNPSVESAATGWTAVGSAITRTRERARFDSWGLQVVTTGAAMGEGVFVRTSLVAGKPGNYTASIYVRGQGKLRIRIYDGLTGTVTTSKPFVVDDVRWRRVEVSGTGSGSDDLRLYVETAENAQAVTFYVDGAQIEPKAYSTTYCDGRREECRWNGVSDASYSSRYDNCYSGGEWLKLSDPDANIYATIIGGQGAAPVAVNFQRTAQYPGATFDNLRVNERSLTMAITAVDKDGPRRGPRDLTGLHNLRSQLLDLVKPDRNPNNNPLILGYRNDDVLLTMQVRYEGGLEFDGDIRNVFYNTIPLRFLALDPFWYEDSQEAVVLDTETSLANIRFCAARVNGAWGTVGANGVGGGGVNVDVIYEAPDGRIYLGGSFTTTGGGTTVRRFGSLSDNNSTLIERGNGTNDVVRDIVAHPNGKIYLCGDFTSTGPGGPTLNGIAEYDPATNTMAALGTGLTGGVARALAVGPDGSVYVVGSFTTAGGIPAPRAARWDGSSWHSVGDLTNDIPFSSANLYDIVIRDTDDIYASGQVVTSPTSQFLIHFNGTEWETLTGASEAAATSSAAQVIFDSITGYLLIGHGGYIKRWNGSTVSTISPLLNLLPPDSGGGVGTIYAMDEDEAGNLYVAGSFFYTSGITLDAPLVVWNGAIFAPIDLQIPMDNPLTLLGLAAMVSSSGDVYFGWEDSSPPATFFGTASGLVDHAGAGSTYSIPVVELTGPGRLVFLENQVTGERVYLNYDIVDDEILTLDFNQEKPVASSNYRGAVTDAILPNSDNLSVFPGGGSRSVDNRFALFITNEVAPTGQLRYIPRHWSFDAVVFPQ